MAARIVAIGPPVQKGSKRGFLHPHTGRVLIVDERSADLKRWEKLVGNAVEAWRARKGGALYDGPVVVTLTFSMRRPQGVSPAARPWPSVAPDLDKLTRAVLDALTSTLYRDDSQVVALCVCKRYADPQGVTIEVDAARPEIRGLKLPPTIGELIAANTQEEPTPC